MIKYRELLFSFVKINGIYYIIDGYNNSYNYSITTFEYIKVKQKN